MSATVFHRRFTQTWSLGWFPAVASGQDLTVKFVELVRLLESNGFTLMKEKGSIRYYGKQGWDRLIRIDYHGSKEVPTGTCHAILKDAGIKKTR